MFVVIGNEKKKLAIAFAFSPDCQHVAVVGLDGLLRVINFVHET